MIRTLFNWLTGGVVEKAFDIVKRYVPDADEQSRINAELAMEAGRQHVQALSATASFRWWHPQNLIAYSVAGYVFKIVMWDTVLGWGVTPNPGEHVTWLMMAVVGFYFLNRGIVDAAARIASGRSSHVR